MANLDFGSNVGSDFNNPDQGQGVTDPTPRDNSTPDPWTDPSNNAVKGYYESLLGRDPESLDVVTNWLRGAGGNLDQVKSGIAGSAEAKAYASRGTYAGDVVQNGGAAAPQTDKARIDAMLAKYGSTDDPNYWYGIAAQHGGVDATGAAWLEDRIMRGDGSALVRNGTVQKFADGPATTNTSAGPFINNGTNPGGYTDPSSMIYLNQVLQRLQQVQQPQDNSILELLKQLANSQVQKLQQAPYSAADDAALITKYRDPLNTARDTAKQQAALEMSRRGIGPTSGVYQDRMKQIDQSYVKGIAQGANQMGVDAVTQKNTNALQALQILNSLNTVNNTQTDRQNAAQDQAVTLAKLFPDFDAQRLNQLLQASGDSSAASTIGGLTSLGNLNLNAIGMNNQSDTANAAAWAKIIAQLFGAI